MEEFREGNMYFVATPIGNLKDMTLRSLEILKEVDEIYCEDTRNSKILLNHFEIFKPLYTYHKYNEREVSPIIIDKLKNGKKIAYISDAGLPCISDPGEILIQELKKEKINYCVLPGANACVTAFAGSGFSSPFTFIGFLPETNKKQEELLNEIKTYKSSLVFYVSKYDLKKDLKTLYEYLGKRNFMIANELTKLYEKRIFGVLGEEIEQEYKGEFVVVVEGNKEENKDLIDKSVQEHFEYYVNLGYSKKDAIKQVAKERNVNKNEIYQEVIRNE